MLKCIHYRLHFFCFALHQKREGGCRFQFMQKLREGLVKTHHAPDNINWLQVLLLQSSKDYIKWLKQKYIFNCAFLFLS